MGLNLFTELSSWLETITLVRNIIAHHSRLWSKNFPKRPVMQLNNPARAWLTRPLQQAQMNKPFAVISCMVYLCSFLSKSEVIKKQIIDLIASYPNVPIYKNGFLNNWQTEPLWN